MPGLAARPKIKTARHALIVRLTHWLTVVAFAALLVTGLEIVVSHPRFYLGEVGNVMTKPLFTIPIPASRDSVATGYSYTMPDQNGWSRYLHFEAAWVAVLTGLVYVVWGVWRGHFLKSMVPLRGQRSLGDYWKVMASTFRRDGNKSEDGLSYNSLQRVTYLIVVFVLFPLMIWTGLAMSPAFTGAFPWTVILLGGRQTARTLHLLLTVLLTAFVIVHVVMIIRAGFKSRMQAMIMGQVTQEEDQ